MSDQVPVTSEPVPAPPRRRFARTRRALSHIPYPPLRSRRGILLTFFLVAGFGSVVTMAGVAAVGFTETSAFCGLCHTMAPEMKAYQMSSHSELACAECHVEPGAGGWVKAKVAGTRQLVEYVTGTFPQPIPPPDHANLPDVKDTCLRCHSLQQITENGGPVKLVLRPTYGTDKKNTRNVVAVVLRPAGLDTTDDSGTVVDTAAEGPRGVHWHVQQDVTYTSADPRAQTIDSVRVTNEDGTVEDFISASVIGLSSNVTPDLAKLQATETTRTMMCLDCHNRAGHGQPTPSQALDTALAAGRISPDLPYIKKYALDLLEAEYATTVDADAAIDRLGDTYRRLYPTLAAGVQAKIGDAAEEIKAIYASLATPEMKVQAKTYPNNLGHQSSPGCFRCHDGAHYKVEAGKVTTETIPSSCSTCHSFPQVGSAITGLLLGGQPASHNDSLWVFNHKDAAAAIAAERNAQAKKLPAKSVDPVGTTCGTCHQRSYCEDCHSTGAIKVQHDEMLYNHAASIRVSGGKACAYCHQAVVCATCHTGNVLDTPAIKTNGTVTS